MTGRAVLVVALALGAGGCVGSRTREPANIYPLKLEIRAYVESGRYMSDIAVVAQRAQAWLEERAKRTRDGERLAVVFDLDETLLYNWPHISGNDFGYLPAEWNAWVDQGQVPAIDAVREVYRSARRLGVEVFFITGRRERDRSGTERNLRTIGCAEYAALICKGDESKGTSAAFKTAARERLAKEGWAIIANIGDQHSDLTGGFSERTFKLPNPFYVTE